MAVLNAGLIERVAEIIPRYSMLSPGDRLGVAVSGGADSVALLHILYRLRSQFAATLTVLHVNHQLRGEQSLEDEQFVRRLGESLGLPVIVEQAPVAGGNLEQETRRARRAFFQACMRNCDLNRIALGHTRSDQAETVLFRLLRGSGLAGLAAMRPVTSEGYIRPLLTTSREEARAWAAAERLSWREDASNDDLRFARNRLRKEVVPRLRDEFNPNLEGVLAGLAALAGDEEDYWMEQIEPIYQQLAKRSRWGLMFKTAELHALSRAVQRRLLRHALREIRGNLRSIDMEHVEALLRISGSGHGHDRVIIPGVDAFRSFETLLLAQPREFDREARHYRLELPLDVECELPFQAGFICVTHLHPRPRNCAKVEEEQGFSTEWADLDERAVAEAGGALAVRNWGPGDELQRPGHTGPTKVKSLFQEYKVLLWERRHWPVVVAGNEIAWVRRFGAAARFCAGDENRRLRLRFRPVPGVQT